MSNPNERLTAPPLARRGWNRWAQAAALVAMCSLGSSRAVSSKLPHGVKAPAHAAGQGEDSTLDSLRALSRAEGYLCIGQPRVALQQLRHLKDAELLSFQTARLRAWAWLELDQADQVIEQYGTSIDPSSTESRFLLGRAQRQLGHHARATKTLQRLWWMHPEGVWGIMALRELAALPAPHVLFSERDRHLILKTLPAPSVKLAERWSHASTAALKKLAAAAAPGGIAATELDHALGVRLLHKEEFTPASALLRRALATKPSGDFARIVRLHLAQALRRRGVYDQARTHLQAIAEESPTDDIARTANSIAGQMAIEYQRYDEASRGFRAQLLQSPVGGERRAALWGLGWVAFRQAQYRDARRFFAALVDESPFAELAPAGLYWSGRAVFEMGDPTAAAQLWGLVLHRFPTDYYAYQAHNRLRAMPQCRSEPTCHDAFSIASTSSAASAEAQVAPDTRVALISAASRAGMYKRTRDLLRRVIPEHAVEFAPHELSVIAEAAEASGANAQYQWVQRYSARRFPMQQPRAAVAHLESMFETPFAATIEKKAQQGRVPVDFVMALVRQESRFNPRAVSAAGAIGLMQLMPKTAEALLSECKAAGGVRNADIFDADNNLQLGTRYLGRMLRAFAHHPEYALAAYNAGPGAVTRWRQRRGELPADIFVEEIPYAETRQYTKKVMANVQAYRLMLRLRQHPQTIATTAQ